MSDEFSEMMNWRKEGWLQASRRIHSRWKSGQCANPCRPAQRVHSNFKTEFKRMMEAPVVVNDKGKPKKITTLKGDRCSRLREKASEGQ